LKKILLLILIILVFGLGIYVLRKNPQEQVKKVIFPTEFRVMTYNINHGVGSDGLYGLYRIAEIIREQAPHIVCLNDVDNNAVRTYQDDQARKIAAELGMQFTSARNSEIQGGWHGNAILTRMPIDFSENKLLPGNDQEPTREGVLHIIVTLNNKQLHLYTTQLNADSLVAAEEVKGLLKIVLDWGVNQPVIITGDFKFSDPNQGLHEMSYYFLDLTSHIEGKAFTYPADRPTKGMDHVFMNDRIAPLSVVIVDNEKTRLASNHLPVVARFRLK
jgi:endonuclease/exonuclease/phosphatase family metal-dependent hydrolase